jgi:hypothetical protein
MKLSDDQLAMFGARREAAFVGVTAAHLARRHPGALERQRISREKLEKFVRDSMGAAARYQVVNEPDIRMYCECRLLLGMNFDRDAKLPWASEILQRRDLDGEAKMNLLDEHMAWNLELRL